MKNKERETEVNMQEPEFERGYSEAEQAKDREARSGDLFAMKKGRRFQKPNNSAKTLAAYQSVSRQLSTVVSQYAKLVEVDLHRAQKMRFEIAKIRAKQKVLLTKLFGTLPEEIRDKEVLDELKEVI